MEFPLLDAKDIDAIVTRLAFHPQIVLASPAARCRALADAIPATDRRFDARLLELDFGHWEGKRWDAIDRSEFDRWAADPISHAPPEGETGATLIARVTAVFDEVIASRADHAIVTHGGPLKVLTRLARGLPIDLFAPAPPLGSVQIHAL